MAFKFNIADKEGRSWKFELESEAVVGKNLGDKFDGKEIKPELEGFELEITGGSDIAGFPLSKTIEGSGLKRVLLIKGWGMRDSREGIRLRKSVRGKQISLNVSQINLRIVKDGKRKIAEVFPEQNKVKEIKEQKVEAPAVASI